VTPADVADVTVIVPTKGRAQLLQRALTSLAAQTTVPCEVIVAEDGGVTDETAAAVALARDAGLTVRHLPSLGGGAARARNMGIERTTSAFIAFLDDDDRWQPAFVERCLSAIDEHGAGAAVTDIEIRRSDAVLLHHAMLGTVDDALHRNVGFTGQNGVFTTDDVVAVGGFDPELRALQDRDLQLRLLRRGVTFIVVHESLAVVDHSHQYSRISTSDSRAVGCVQFLRKWWPDAGLRTRALMVRQALVGQRHSSSRVRRAVGRSTLWLNEGVGVGRRVLQRLRRRLLQRQG
jgi:glycosyltransferase involved in cell wall biosynthesis